MTIDGVIHELRTLTVPGASGARGRAVAAAHRAYEQRGVAGAPRRRGPQRVAAAVVSVAVVIAISLTPAGHAAAGWVTQLVGLGHIPANHPPRGHIGGRSTDPTSVGLTKPYPQIVIGKGRTPTGQPYEVSVYRSPQNKYGTCFAFWSPRVGQPTAQKTGQCSSQVRRQVIGDFCVANSSGCGDAHHSRRTWTSPAIAAVSHDVARLKIHPTTPDSHVRGLRILPLPRKFQHEVRAPQPVNVALFFVVHQPRSPVRFDVTAYDRKDRVLASTRDGVGAAGAWHPRSWQGRLGAG
jgi:hypothetical protein